MKATMKLTLGLSVLAMAMGGVAYARQDAPGGQAMGGPAMGGSMMEGDGVVTRDEARKKAEEMFARLDANHDGKLDQTDREAHRAEMRERMFDRLDANHDGSISKDEFMAERGMGEKGMEGHGGHAMGDDADGPGGAGMKARHGMRGHRGGMMMGRMGGDGVITQAEFVDRAMKRFDAMDANHDGQVTREERQAARQQMMSRWKADKTPEN